jgi:hypothetical protein
LEEIEEQLSIAVMTMRDTENAMYLPLLKKSIATHQLVQQCTTPSTDVYNHLQQIRDELDALGDPDSDSGMPCPPHVNVHMKNNGCFCMQTRMFCMCPQGYHLFLCSILSNCQRGDNVGCCPNASASPERLGCPLLHMLYLTVNSSVAGMATICKRRFQSVYQ